MLPQFKTSRSRKRLRRSHHALKPTNVAFCPKCSQPKLSHTACDNCGYVNAKVAIPVAEEE
jgi:large subunit ribosomal protein L32